MNHSLSEPRSIAEDEILSRVPGRIPTRVLALSWSLTLIGLAGFLLGLREAPQRAWQVYLVNFLFFSGLAAAGVIFGAVVQVAKGHWGRPMHRVAQGFGAFLPISYILFLALYLGRERIFPWIADPVNFAGHAIRTEWLNTTGVFGRGAVFLLLLCAGCLIFMYYSLRPDMPAISSRLDGWRRRLTSWMGRDYRGAREEEQRSQRILGRLSPALLLGYVIILSGMAIDLVMSLEPGWISVLFPAYFFVGAWLCALAGLAAMAALLQRSTGTTLFAENHWHDLGKLIFAFCIFWAYLWFSQYLPIWYGNMPRETIFIEPRSQAPWLAVSVTFFALVFVLPFVLLLARKPKTIPWFLGSVSGLILVGFWLERFDLVVPSIWTGGVPLGWIELLVTAGFVGLFGLSYALYFSTFPLLPVRRSLMEGKPRTGPY